MPVTATRAHPVRRSSLSDLVYDRLVDDLLAGRFNCGDELNEVLLARQLHVSRTPVREALRRLASEGLVVTKPNRLSTVVELSRRDVIETYQVRKILEAAAARLAAERVSVAQLAELQRLSRAAVPAAGDDWGEPERRFDEQLHATIAEASGNARLRREIVRYGKLVRFVRARVGRNPDRLDQGHGEHLAIMAALEARDPAAAEMAMSAHIASALQFVLEDLPWE